MNEIMLEKTTNSEILMLNDAIAKDPENAILYYERGWIKQQIHDKNGCLDDWCSALEKNPGYLDVYSSRALIYYLDGNIVLAEKDIKEAELLNPELSTELKHLKQLIIKHKAHPNSILIEYNSRRDFLKKVSLVGIAAAVVVAMPGCTTNILEGEETDVRWGKIIDLNRCVGCKACSVACKAENHTPPGIAYHVVMEEEKGKYPYNKREFLPMPCMQCKNSTCIPICPVKATYYRKDGVVVVDYDKCIGCRYCIATCPYGSRSFDYGHYYSEDKSNPWENMPSPEYGQYRKRKNLKSPIGNVRKCTNCLHRIYNGIPPACAASCMGNAIHFGDLNNPDAKCMVHGVNLQHLLAKRNYKILKEETGNAPRVYYLT